MSDKLEPCPFCGFDRPQLRSNGMGDYHVSCRSDELEDATCGASSSDRRCETPEEAARRWNTRASGWRPNTLVPTEQEEAERDMDEVLMPGGFND